MSMDEDVFEILVGKYLDGEITTAEQEMLQDKFESEPSAKELFEDLQRLHRITQQAVNSEVLQPGGNAEAIVDRAFAQSRGFAGTIARTARRLGFVGGLAAGLAVGL